MYRFKVDLPLQELVKVERATSDAVSLSKELFAVLFKEELETSPLEVNCTKTNDKKRILDQDLLNGIRLHAYYRYPDGMKYGSVKEEERWEKVILKKLNETVRTARKRYRRVHNMPAPTETETDKES